jgi:hypothetical protein
MPQIIVTADRRPDRGDGAVLLRERVTVSDFESDHFVVHLLERLGWAVDDAYEVERRAHDNTTRQADHDHAHDDNTTHEVDHDSHAEDETRQPVTT